MPLNMFRLAGLLLLSLTAAFSQDDMPKNQKAQTFERQITKTVSVSYLLFVPAEYNDKGFKKWPLMLFLHGSGERGTNVAKVGVHGPPKILKDRPDFPFIVVSPQCPSGQTWDNDVLLALLDEIIAKYAVDTNRVYLTGLSMGGFGTWSLGLSHPERFAAIAPICGGGDRLKVLLSNPLIKTLPVWAFHGAKDPVVKLEESQRMVDALKSIGNDAKLTIYPEAQHDSWTETYDNQELYDWFLQHERKPKAKKEAKASRQRRRSEAV